MENFKFDVIIPHLNYQDVEKSIRSLRNKTPKENLGKIILINQSGINYPWIKELIDIHVELPNQGFARANNLGMRLSDAEFVACMNDDVEIIHPSWVEGIIETFRRYDNALCVNPASPRNPRASGDIPIDHPDFPYREEWTDEEYNRLLTEVGKGHVIDGICMWFPIFRKKLLNELPGSIPDRCWFDEIFLTGGGEDYDMCYDKNTEIVTKNGIKLMKDISFNDSILTLNNNGELEYHRPVRLIKKKDKKLLHFKSKRIDLMVTPEQELLVGYEYKQKRIKKDIDFVRANEINKKLWNKQCRYFVKKNGGLWRGKDKKKIKIGNNSYDSENFVRFMGWYLSEGNVCHTNFIKRRDNSIKISQSLKNKNNRNEIIETIKRLGFSPRIYKDCIVFSDKQLSIYLRNFGKCNEKFISQEIKDLPPKYLNIFLETYIKGDGNKRKDGFNITTVSNKMKDDLIEIILKTGHTFNLSKSRDRINKFKNGNYNCKPCWQIQVRIERENRAYLRKAKEVIYNDFVYDIEVPNHRIYVIRNGKGCWSSNCRRAYLSGMRCLGTNLSYVYHWWYSTKKPGTNEATVKYDYGFGRKWQHPNPDLYGKIGSTDIPKNTIRNT